MFGFSAFGGAALGATGESGSPPVTEGWGSGAWGGTPWGGAISVVVNVTGVSGTGSVGTVTFQVNETVQVTGV